LEFYKTTEEERLREEVPKSRRERRRERRRKSWLANLTSLLVPRQASRVPKATAKKERLRKEAPKSRRERRELRWAQQRNKWRGGFSEFMITVLIAFVLVFGVVRPFVVEAFRIPSESMVPTLEVGDRVLANKFIYRFSEPERGDIVVFENVEAGQYEDIEDTLIKRVVGVEGDEIQVQNGSLSVNGEAPQEPYLNYEDPFRGFYGPITVPPNHLFMMGDNRNNSGDSRIFGPVPLENLKGKAFLRFWPISRIGSF
jgi:signal peptidase I